MMEFMMIFSSLFMHKYFNMSWLGNFYCMFLMTQILKITYSYSVLNNFLATDFMALGLMMLTCWIFCLASLSMPKLNNFLLLMSMFSMLYLVFHSLNLLMFYTFFELVSIPMCLLIMKWGNQPERLKSTMYMLSFTMVGALPFLLGLLMNKNGNFMYMYMIFYEINYSFLFIIAFMVKLPIYSLHLWLPKAHVEAPVMGSMLLAGLLLKLGGYGMIRLMLFMNLWKELIMIMGLWGAFISSLICLREVDLKKLVAYSSIHHMGFMLSGIATSSMWGLSGAILMMLSHGLCSSGMFCMVNMIYERFYTRSLILIKGIMLIQPTFCLWWFIMIMGNMGSPPFLGIMAEILLMMSIIMSHFILWIIIFLMLVVSVAYSIHLYSNISHGVPYLMSMNPFTVREYQLSNLHFVPFMLSIYKLVLFLY